MSPSRLRPMVSSRLPGTCILPLLVLLGLAASLQAEVPRVLPAGQLPQDKRLGELITLNSYFPFAPSASPEAWAKRAKRVRRQLLVATGLWPMPTKTPANAVIHGKIDRGDYTVEKVFLESFPGHFVTGNLYRPKGTRGPGPGVLCPHGHWANGRFYDAGEKKVRQEIEHGAEKYDPAGRYPIQARCAKLARMGCTVFQYDMVGYADSTQLPHRPGLRQQMNTPESWGYFSPQAESRMQNTMGLQTYNSIRALDWLGDLPEVDPKRIGVTGASGGGTQTFILCAADPRPAVAFPAVMVSTAMQGGCTCENACYLRVETGNIELAALIAPRPLGMTAANDWTQEIETKGLPELKQLYTMLGVEDLVMARHFPFPHNYNYVSRGVMYGWMNRHLKLGQAEPIVEDDFEPLSAAELSVWDDEHPKPPGGEEHERALLRWITEDSEKQMAALVPSDGASLERYREVVGGAVDVMIGRGLPERGEVTVDWQPSDASVFAKHQLALGLLNVKSRGEQLPLVMLMPSPGEKWNRQAVVWIDKLGKQAMFEQHGKPKAAIQKLLDGGMAVIGVDLFGQGEFTADGKPPAKARLDPKRTHYAGYTYGYNHPVFSQRVHDILSVVALLRHGAHGDPGAEKVHLVGLGGAGHWVAAAAARAGKAVDRVVVDTAGFRFARLTAFEDPDFLPGGAKYLDLPGILALAAPHELWLAGEGAEAPEVLTAAYRAAGAANRLTLSSGDQADKQEEKALGWLLR